MRVGVLMLVCGVCVVLWGGGGSPVRADSSRDHDRARSALQSGEILSLREIAARVERDYPGELIEVELDRGRSGWEYELTILGQGGNVIKLRVDARDGSFLSVKGRAFDRTRDRGREERD